MMNFYVKTSQIKFDITTMRNLCAALQNGGVLWIREILQKEYTLQ